MARFDVTTYGEGGLRLSVPTGERLEIANSLNIDIAGAEANVACTLARLNWQCGWISGLPLTPLGHRVANEYRQHGLDLSAVAWFETGRLSTYFVEYAAPPRPTQVYYDRANSCFTQLHLSQIDWDYLLDTRLIHLTGISVPLSKQCRAIVNDTIQRAHDVDVPISFDINYRHNLWSPEDAAKTLSPLMQGVELLFCSQRDAQLLFKCHGSPLDIAAQLAEQSQAKHVIVSLNDEGLIGWHEGQNFEQPAVQVGIVDRIGAGDGLAAGVIHGWLQNDFAKGIRYGAMVAALALSQRGEQVLTSATELERLLNTAGTTIFR